MDHSDYFPLLSKALDDILATSWKQPRTEVNQWLDDLLGRMLRRVGNDEEARLEISRRVAETSLMSAIMNDLPYEVVRSDYDRLKSLGCRSLPSWAQFSFLFASYCYGSKNYAECIQSLEEVLSISIIQPGDEPLLSVRELNMCKCLLGKARSASLEERSNPKDAPRLAPDDLEVTRSRNSEDNLGQINFDSPMAASGVQIILGSPVRDRDPLNEYRVVDIIVGQNSRCWATFWRDPLKRDGYQIVEPGMVICCHIDDSDIKDVVNDLLHQGKLETVFVPRE